MQATAQLTARQAAFIPAFLASGNATASAVKAGFSVRGASVAGNRMLRNARVQAAIQARQSADAARLSISREDVLAGLLEAVNLARDQRNPAGMVGGLKELAKMLGMYPVDRLKVDVDVGGVGQAEMGRMERMTDAELLAIIEAGRAAT